LIRPPATPPRSIRALIRQGSPFRFSTTVGTATAIGIAVARFDYQHALQPVRDDDARPRS
jgi:hypothetical protein